MLKVQIALPELGPSATVLLETPHAKAYSGDFLSFV